MEWSAEHNRYIEPSNPKRNPAAGARSWRSSIVRLMIFSIVFAALQLGWQSLRGGGVEYAVIHDATVRPAVFAVNYLTPDVAARAVKFSLHAPGGGLNVLNGCEGLEALFLLAAACVVAPISMMSRLAGLLLGLPVVFIVNQARIVALFYAYRDDPQLFYSLHATVAPIIVVVCVAAYFYGWLAYASRTPSQTA